MSEEKIHDYRSDTSADGAVLIVRKGCKYGAAGAGERVRVDERELLNRSTMETCMSEDDYEEFLEKSEKERAKKKQPKVSPLKMAVDAGLARIAADGERKAKEKAKLEAAAPPPVPEPVIEKNPKKR